MSGFQMVTILGRLGKDPVLRYTQNGTAVAELSIATTKKFNNKQTGQKEEKTEWHRCKAFGKTAETLINYTQKGSQIHVTGELETSKYQDKQTGQDRYSTEIIINNLTLVSSPNNAGQGQQPNASHQQGGFNGQNQGNQPPQQPQNGFNGQNQGNQPPPQQGGFNGQQQANAPQQQNNGFNGQPQNNGFNNGGFNQQGGFG